MKSVYIETTIPSYYFETRKGPTIVAWREATRRWWDHYRIRYQLYTSQAVRSELARGPIAKARRALKLIDACGLLRESQDVIDIVKEYVRQRLMPAEPPDGDAYHLAMASLNRIDYLLTWNCRHLANANKVRHIEVINRRLGLHVPIVTTPQLLVPEIRS